MDSLESLKVKEIIFWLHLLTSEFGHSSVPARAV